MNLRIEIPGTPIAKKRPRFFVRGKHVGAYNAQGTEEGKFVLCAMSQLVGHDPIPAGFPVRIECWFDMPCPASMPKRLLRVVDGGVARVPHVKKPDLDNLVKFVKDCFNEVVWTDDSQVVRLDAYKNYSTCPKTIVKVWW